MTDKKLTDEEIIKAALEEEIHLAEYVDSDYCSNTEVSLLKSTLDLITHLQEENETLKEFIVETRRCDKEIKSEARKEFAEKLKEKSFKTIRNYGLTKDVVEVCDIDTLLKEMVGEEK